MFMALQIEFAEIIRHRVEDTIGNAPNLFFNDRKHTTFCSDLFNNGLNCCALIPHV